MGQRVVSGFSGEIQRVGVTSAQESFNRQGFVEWRPGVFRGLPGKFGYARTPRSEEHTSELQSHLNLVCRLLLEKKKQKGRSSQPYWRVPWISTLLSHW